MRAPFYKIILEGNTKVDITDFVDNFSYEDCMSEDSVCSFNFYNDKAVSLMNNVKIDKGMTISFQFGFLGENPSQVHKKILKDIEPDYDDKGVSLTLGLYDKSIDMKKADSQKIWKGKTVPDIIKELADNYKLNPVIGHRILKNVVSKTIHIPQGGMNDLEFLRFLADRAVDGNYVTYVRNGQLYFVKRGTDKKSKVTYTWGEGDAGLFVSFKIKDRESRTKKGAHKTTVSGLDLTTLKANASVATNQTEKNVTTLGQVKNLYNAVDGDEIRKYIEKIVPSPADSDEASNLANTEKQEGSLDAIKATMKIMGNPHLEPNDVITVNGVIDRYCGNWLIDKITHSIGSGYYSTLELVKNGKKRGLGDPADKNNSDVGPDKAKKKVKLRQYLAPTGSRVQDITTTEDQ